MVNTQRDKKENRAAVTNTRITAAHAGQRLDNFLFARYRNLPKSRVYGMIRGGEVRINSRRAKPSNKLSAGDTVRIPPVTVTSRQPPNIPRGHVLAAERRIIFEDEALLILNKPAGISAHSGSRNSFGLIDVLKRLRPQNDVALAHRLDKGVSGCIAIAKTRPALLALHKAFREQAAEKTYLALTQGHWRKPQAVGLPLARAPHKQVVAERGRRALSHFAPQEHIGDYTLISVRIATGRTHQIRVHAAHCGHPLAGDKKYGDFKDNRKLEKLGLKRIFLHASQLAFEWHGEKRSFEAPLPDELQSLLRALNSAKMER